MASERAKCSCRCTIRRSIASRFRPSIRTRASPPTKPAPSRSASWSPGKPLRDSLARARELARQLFHARQRVEGFVGRLPLAFEWRQREPELLEPRKRTLHGSEHAFRVGNIVAQQADAGGQRLQRR